MNHSSTPQILLTIAGFDPSCGAGIPADLKTFAAHNAYGIACVTALTVQNSQGVRSLDPTPAKTLRAQLVCLLEDVKIAAVKIGLLATRANAEVVAEFLEANSFAHVVLDPVLRSTSGFPLLDDAGTTALRDHLMRLATVITPNTDEAAALSSITIENLDSMKAAARALIERGARAVVITGGHLEKPTDLFYDGAEFLTFGSDRIKSENTHGTGCTFSAAITANLAAGKQLRDAVMLAKAYVTKAIEKGYPIGQGKGSLNHFYRTQQEAVHRVIEYPPAVGDPSHR